MADSDLRRAHPASVAIGTVKTMWQGVAAIGFVAIGSLGSGPIAPLIISGIILLVTGLSIGFSFLRWRFFRYGVLGDDLVIAEGWLVHKRRTIPLARVQGVDIRANLLMRILGLTDVVVQTAGGGSGEPEAKIGQIALDEAERLRFELLHARRSADTVSTAVAVPAAAARAEMPVDGSATTGGGAAFAPPAGPVGLDPIGRMSDLRGAFGGAESGRAEPTFEHQVSAPRLLLAAATSKSVLIVTATVIAGLSQIIGPLGEELFDRAAGVASTLGVLAIIGVVLVSLLISLIVGTIATIARDFGFTARRVDARVETESGLLERRMTGMPVRRIQALIIEQTALRRWLGWASVQAITAGFGAGEEQRAQTAPALIPIARVEEIPALLRNLLPEVEEFPELAPVPRRAARFYLFAPVVSTALGMLLLVVSAIIIFPPVWPYLLTVGLVVTAIVFTARFLMWRHAGFGTDAHVLGIESGALGRRRVRLGRNRIQSLSMRQNPFQRRAGLATVYAVGVSGSTAAHYRIRHIERADAEQLLTWYAQHPQRT